MHAKIKDGQLVQYPYGFTELQTDNPYTNYGKNTNVAEIFPTTEAATIHGFALESVVFDNAPSYAAETHKAVVADQPVLRDGVWVIEWTVTPKTAEEISLQNSNRAAEVRLDRNTRLTACDWTQLADSTADKTAWAAYRQALRDITVQSGFPWTVTWPTQP